MRYLAFLLLSFVGLASFANAQTGFTTKTYTAILPATSDNTHLLSADFNKDGLPDLFSYGSRSGNSTVPGNVFLNNGSGGFSAPVPLPGTGLLAAAAIGDMNGDGYPDIVGCENVSTSDSQDIDIIVYLNNGDGTFKALAPVEAAGECDVLMLGDLLQNGHLDTITVGSTPGQYGPGGQYYPGAVSDTDFFINDGTGKITEISSGGSTGLLNKPGSTTDYTNCGSTDAAGGDFQQDGNFDLLLATTCKPSSATLSGNEGTVFYAPETMNNGDPQYDTFEYLQSANETYTDGQTADLQNNGIPDVLFLGSHSATQGDLIYGQNDGSDNFTFSSLLQAVHFDGATVGDFNGDGLNDIAATYESNQSNGVPVGPPMLTILSGNKGGSFSDSQDFATGTSTDLGGDVVAADFNGDGTPDLATLVYNTANKTTSLNIYLNDQSKTSTPCSAPTTANTNIICSPANGASVTSPVTVNAASNVSGFTLNRLYLDNKAVYQSTSQVFSTPITATGGSHNLVLVSYNNAGKSFTSSTTFTVGVPTGTGCTPSAPGVSICSPVNGQTYNSAITVTAGAMAQAGDITAMRVYIDNTAVYTANNPSATKTFQFSENLGVTSGSHTLVIVAYESTGASLTHSLTFNAPSGACSAPTGGTSLRICSPSGSQSLSSPVTVNAASDTATGYMAAMRIYIDNSAVDTVDNPQESASFTINQSVPVLAGSHTLVVVGYPSTGGSVSSEEMINVQ